MRDAIGTELPAALNETIVVNDPAAVSRAALLSLGVALISMPEALPYLESNALVRVVPTRSRPHMGEQRTTFAHSEPFSF